MDVPLNRGLKPPAALMASLRDARCYRSAAKSDHRRFVYVVTSCLGSPPGAQAPGYKATSHEWGETELKYEVNGDKIKLEGPQGNIILTLLKDGSLQGPGGEKLTNQTVKQQSLVGVWEKASVAGDFPMGATLELTKDGKVKMAAEVEGKLRTIGGTYQMRGNTLQITFPDGPGTQVLRIQTLTDQRLVLVDQKNREDAFKKKR